MSYISQFLTIAYRLVSVFKRSHDHRIAHMAFSSTVSVLKGKVGAEFLLMTWTGCTDLCFFDSQLKTSVYFW